MLSRLRFCRQYCDQSCLNIEFRVALGEVVVVVEDEEDISIFKASAVQLGQIEQASEETHSNIIQEGATLVGSPSTSWSFHICIQRESKTL